jgi:hypothetical protein
LAHARVEAKAVTRTKPWERRNIVLGTWRLAARILSGGARRDRTDDLMLAKHALSQLSYGPFQRERPEREGAVMPQP